VTDEFCTSISETAFRKGFQFDPGYAPCLHPDLIFQRRWFLGGGETFFFIQKYPEWIWTRAPSYSVGNRGSVPMVKAIRAPN